MLWPGARASLVDVGGWDAGYRAKTLAGQLAGQLRVRAEVLNWTTLAITAGAGMLSGAVLAVAVVLWLVRREPYATFHRLGLRAKLTFLRLLVLDRRLPWYIRALPLAVLVYWISPLDLIPLFPFDDIAFALLVLALMVWLIPRELIGELLTAADSQHPAGRRD